MHCTLEAMTANMNKHETFSGVISFDEQSFSYENHCECYKKLTSRLWHVLFIYIYIYILTRCFLIHTLSSSEEK